MTFRNWLLVALLVMGVFGIAGQSVAQPTTPPPPPGPRVSYANNTPTVSRNSTGAPVSGKIQVDVNWSNASTGGNNTLRFEVLVNTNGVWMARNPVMVGNLGASGSTSQLLDAPPQTMVRINVALIDSGGTVLANQISGDVYTH